jgi:lipoprotein-releasing system permease protein
MIKNFVLTRWEKLSIHHFWKNPWTVWVGYRYLKSKKNSKFLSFITFISIMGVAVGVMAMIVVLSVMDGFESELKKRLMSTDLHILIQPTADAAGFENGFVPKESINPQQTMNLLESRDRSLSNQITSFWPIVSTEVILRTGKKVSGVIVKGVNEERMERLKAQIVESAEPQMLVQSEGPNTVRLPAIIVGQELAYEIGLIPGDEVTLISPTETEGPLDNVPRFKKFVIEGIYRSGLPDQELHTVFAPASSVRSFLKRAGVVSQWEISVKDFEKAPEVAMNLKELMPKFKVQDWIQLNTFLFASLKLERVAMFVVLLFIIVVASFNIVTTLTLMVLEKKREISIMKAMGARNSELGAVFLSEGILIGTVGVIVGVTVGGLICAILKRYEFIQLPDIYYDRTLPVTFDWMYYFGVSISALVIVILACRYPSQRAAKIHPLEGIRLG